MSKKIRISAVSYLNTFPFIQGLEKNEISEQIDLSLDYPSTCAKKLINGEVDISLLPTAILPQMNGSEIISDYCIGTREKVRTVLLLSEKPIDQLTEIYLDYQSSTSVKLIRIITEKYRGLSIDWKETEEGFEDQVIKGNSGALVIGDRCFTLENKYPYRYDLGSEWYRFTGLPFVFAVWVSRIDLPDGFVSKFNQSLQTGIDNLDYKARFKTIPSFLGENDLRTYFKDNIEYYLTPDMHISMKQFFDDLKELQID